MYRLKSPLQIYVGKKKVILNLNNYRNLHYRILNSAKIVYKKYMELQIKKLPQLVPPLRITYTVFKGDRRVCDVGNICAVHQKFFEDALVELGKIKDDNHVLIPEVNYRWGGVDKLNPGVEIYIEEIKS